MLSPLESYNMPHPIGGRYVGGNMAMYNRAINEGGGLSAADQPKRHNFSRNFLGDRTHSTIDEQMTAGMYPASGLAAPPDGTYGIIEGVVAKAAQERGVLPANLQDVAWAGFKGVPGKPMIRHVNEAIARTSALTGTEQDEVLRRLILEAAPLF
jgi:hypothetical protein